VLTTTLRAGEMQRREAPDAALELRPLLWSNCWMRNRDQGTLWRMNAVLRSVAAAIFSLVIMIGPSGAAEPKATSSDAPPGAEYCLSLIRIRDSKILDSKHMLFTMTDKSMYLNTLPSKCAGMDPGDAYTFRTSLNSLCNQDVITILYPGGHGMLPGVSCGLGMFEPVTQEQVDALKLQIEAESH